MTIAEKERERTRRYRQELPFIVNGLREGREAVDLARSVSERSAADERESFQWVRSVEESVERYRRRRAVITVIPIWTGGASAAAGVILWLTGATDSGIAIAGALVAAGLAAVVLSALRGYRLKGNVYEKWLASVGDR